MIDLHDDEQMEQFRKLHRIDPHTLKQFRNRLLKQFCSDTDATGFLVHSDTAGDSEQSLQLHSLTLSQRHDSSEDGASRLLFQTSDGLLLESVILRNATGRTTLCVSSQVGCAAACRFCATGQMGIARNLNVAQILDQVVQSGQLLRSEGRSLRNVVFMGMGEPFHNEDQVLRAVQILCDPHRFGFRGSGVTVSTVGVADAMVRLADRCPDVCQALSLHSAIPEVRESLMPLARRYSLPDLKDAVREVNRRSGRPVMIEYLMLDGITDDQQSVDSLQDWLTDLDVRVNLIPFNSVPGDSDLKCSPRAVISKFAQALRQTGVPVSIRYSLGQDVAAACGQLVRQENRRRAVTPGATQ